MNNFALSTIFTSSMIILIVVLVIFLMAITVSFCLYSKLRSNSQHNEDFFTPPDISRNFDETLHSENLNEKRKRRSNISAITNVTTITDHSDSRSLERSFYWIPTDFPGPMNANLNLENSHFNAHYNHGLQSNMNTLRKSHASVFLV